MFLPLTFSQGYKLIRWWLEGKIPHSKTLSIHPANEDTAADAAAVFDAVSLLMMWMRKPGCDGLGQNTFLIQVSFLL